MGLRRTLNLLLIAAGEATAFDWSWAGPAGDVPGFSACLAWTPGGETIVAVCANLSKLADGRNPAELLVRA